MTFRRYVSVLLLMTAAVPVVAAAFSLAVDPYDFRGMLGITRIDLRRRNLHGEFPFDVQWTGLSYNVRWLKPDAAAFGSSAVGGMMNYHELGTDPAHRFGQRPFYYSAAGVSIGQMRHYFFHTEALSPLDSALVELQFYMFNADNQRLGPAFFDVPFAHLPNYRRHFLLSMAEIAFTQTATTESIDTMSMRLFDGRTTSQLWSQLWPAPPAVAATAAPPSTTPEEFRARVLTIDRAIFIGLFQASRSFRFVGEDGSDTFDHLRAIIAEARRRKTRLRLFLSPSHARMYEIIRIDGLWPLFEEWKRRVAAVVAEDAAAHPDDPIRLWDFANYNSVTTEPFPVVASPTIGYQRYLDTVHFSSKTANPTLDRLFDTHNPERPIPEDFGVVLTPANVESVLAENRTQQAIYEREHRAELDELKRAIEPLTH